MIKHGRKLQKKYKMIMDFFDDFNDLKIINSNYYYFYF